MNIEELHDYAMNLGIVEDALPFGPDTIVYKINGKIFLLIAADETPLRFNVKCNPDLAIELREQNTSVLSGYPRRHATAEVLLEERGGRFVASHGRGQARAGAALASDQSASARFPRRHDRQSLQEHPA